MKRHVYTVEEMSAMHRALHRACGLPPLTMGYSDQDAWRTFLLVMQPLETDTEEGRFKLEDLVEALSEMNRQRSKGISWSMRPTKILRDPEAMRDLVLIVREKKRARNRPAPVVQPRRMAEVTQAVEVDPALESEPIEVRAAMEAELQKLKENLRNGL